MTTLIKTLAAFAVGTTLATGAFAQTAKERELEARIPVRRWAEVTASACPLGRRLGAQGVVGGAPLGVGKHGVGLVHLGHALGGVGLLADIGVKFARLLAKGLLHLVGRGVLVHTEGSVVILEFHAHLLLRRPLYASGGAWQEE